MNSPVVLYSLKGWMHLYYAVWSIRSLQKFDYSRVEVIVATKDEKDLLTAHCPGIICHIVDIELKGYPLFSYKPFVLKKYIDNIGPQHRARDIVICDADILWRKDPRPLFERFNRLNWVHKITAVNPQDYLMPKDLIPASNIGLRTIQNYAARCAVSKYPNFVLNAGLFMLPEQIFPEMLNNWFDKILTLPPSEMLMSEALMSLTYAEMNLEPTADNCDIKYLGVEDNKTNLPVLSFKAAPECPPNFYTGYQTAKHYYGAQRHLLCTDARDMSLDYDNLAPRVKKELIVKHISKIPRKVINKLPNIIKRTKDKTIYYVVDNKGWVQHRRFNYLAKFVEHYKLKLVTIRTFKLLWYLGFLNKKPLYFSTWRIVHKLIKENPRIFKDSDFGFFMAAVTSHSNIGGGLDPLNPIPGRTPEEAFSLAVGLLKKFKVVSVNSMILYELLNRSLPNLLYCPNGVDADFFTPRDNKEYNPKRIRIGWVGKERGPKNYPVLEKASRELEQLGIFKTYVIKVPKNFKKVPMSFKKMKDFYKNIDFYLCTSWNEGTPNPALEAGACGVPVVTTRVGNMPELIETDKNGFFIEPNVDSIVSRFKEISQINEEKYRQMSKNVRDSVASNWTWKKQAKNFASAFEELLKNQSSST